MKTAHFRLPSASQKRACLSSLVKNHSACARPRDFKCFSRLETLCNLRTRFKNSAYRMDFFELEVFCEYAYWQLVPAHVSASRMFSIKHHKSTPLRVVRNKPGKSKKRTKNFVMSYDVIYTVSISFPEPSLPLSSGTGKRRPPGRCVYEATT